MQVGGSVHIDKRPAGPIFVVGSMRSGSTLLRLILDSHPRIAIGSETGFMGAVQANKSIPAWKAGKDWYRRLDWTEKEFDARLRDFYGGLFERYAARQGKSRWGEKTPFHTSYMPTMAQVFPDAVFIGIVRHPGAVAASLRKNFHYSFAEALSYWKATNLEIVRSASALGSRFAACRYEDLVAHGEPVLREIVGWLDEPWSADLLEHHRVQRDKGAPRAVEGGTITRDPIDAARARRWAESTAADELQALEATSGLAAFFGYKGPDTLDGVFAPPGSPTPWIATGQDIARRCHEWSDRVDFTERPPTIVIDASPEELARRLSRVERALAHSRARRSVRLADAMRKVQHGRSWRDVRDAWAMVRGPHG